MSDPSQLEFKPDFAEAKKRWLAFWSNEIIDRPCCSIRSPKDGVPIPPHPHYMAGARGDIRPVAEAALAYNAAIWHGGEAMPLYTPSFGPDMFATWLGAELEFDDREFGTNWAKPCIDDWHAALPIKLHEDSHWWRRMLEFCRTLAEVFEGKMLVAHLDLHSNIDALSAMRLPGPLCMDLVDYPELIERALRDVRDLYIPIYDALYEAANMGAYGTSGWVTAYHPEKTNTIQCDFCALIGPAHFRQFVLPALEEEASYLGHTVYHLDGPECLVHLDDLCAIEGLDCIQWVHGARNKEFIEWMDLLKAIQAKGTSLWVPCDTESIKIFHRELKPELLYYDCWASTQAEGEATLKWLVDNT